MTGKEGLSDYTRLVDACLRGNEKAQKALYDRFSSKMMGVCYRYAHNRADAEDILQEGFIKVFTSLKQYQAKGSLEGWIRKIMVNTAINFINKNKRYRYSNDPEEGHAATSGEWAADAPLQYQELINMLHQLPTGYRTIINLYAIEGYSHKEIGNMMGIAEVTSRSQYYRGKEMLTEIKNQQEQFHLSESKKEKNE